MEHYLVGIIEVNPKEILDAGIRKELIKLIAKYLNYNFVFDNVQVLEFKNKLKFVSKLFEGFKKAFEYI